MYAAPALVGRGPRRVPRGRAVRNHSTSQTGSAPDKEARRRVRERAARHRAADQHGRGQDHLLPRHGRSPARGARFARERQPPEAKRRYVLAFFQKLPPCSLVWKPRTVCITGRGVLAEFGHGVRLIIPQFVKPYVKSNKVDSRLQHLEHRII